MALPVQTSSQGDKEQGGQSAAAGARWGPKTFKTINRPQHHADQALGPHTGNKEPLLGCEGPKLEGGAQRRRGGAGLGVPLTGR